MTLADDVNRSCMRRQRSHLDDLRCVDGVAATIGYLSRKVSSLETGVDVVAQKALELEREMARMVSEKNAKGEDNKAVVAMVADVQGRDVVYWNQVAVTLYGENVEARGEAEKKTEAYRVLQENHIRLGAAHRQMADELSAVNREMALLRADRMQTHMQTNKAIPSVPVNTQGKDAVFWHQCARTLQQQYLELAKEFEDKTAQYVNVTENLKGLETVCKNKDVTVAGLQEQVARLIEQRTVLETQMRRFF